MDKQELIKKERFNFDDLCEIMKALRAPDGCPWDKVQTHESIRNDLIEETYEVIEAIDTKNKTLLCEELGDVLLNVIFHAQIEDEKGSFGIEDVTSGVCKKLIYRHPHVFSNVDADTPQKVLENWDKLKAKEKDRKTVADSMRSVPPMLPALMRAEKIGKKAAKVGFDFACAKDASEKIYEEADELMSAQTEEEKFEEYGDLLFACVNLARQMGIDSERALNLATDKFISRFDGVEKAIAKEGRDMSKIEISELDEYWNREKARQKGKKH